MQDVEVSKIQYQQQIAFELAKIARSQTNHNCDISWVCHQDRVFWTFADIKARTPISSVTLLIQEIFQLYTDLSFFILRERIFTSRVLTEMDRGMVRLAAKRISVVKAVDHGLKLHHQLIGLCDSLSRVWGEAAPRQGLVLEFQQNFDHAMDAFQFLGEMVGRIPRGQVLHDFNRPIAALLVDVRGKGLIAASNLNSLNKTLHAEVRCLQFLACELNLSIEPGSKLYVSLKPCQMCAGMLVEMLDSPENIEVIYDQDDPGKLARGSSLEKLGRFRQFTVG